MERGSENDEALFCTQISTALFIEALGFLRMSNALFTAAKQIRKLHIGKDPWLFAEDLETWPVGCAPLFSWTESSPNAHRILVGAFRQLNHLVLHFSSLVGIHMPLNYSFRGLGRLLGELQSLRSLDLILPEGNGCICSMYTYDQIFLPTAGMWPALEDLSLQNLVVRTRDILRLLRGSPRLRNLALFRIVLLDGQWEWIMEYLHEHMELNKLEIMVDCAWDGPSYGLRYPDGTAYGEDKDKYIPKVEQYVVRKGPRPKLHADEEDGMAQRYLEELKRYL